MGVRRTASTLPRLNQVDGFDCQGCAWPDPAPGHRHAAEFCENGAKAVAEEATRQLLDREFFATHSVADLAGRTEFWLGKQGRITEPMVLRPGATHYEPISWDDAFATMADHLRRLDHPDQATFYTSGKTSNEAAFVYQLFVRAFGTNNLPDCSNMCHESSGSALGRDDRHRQGLGQPRGHPPGQADPRRRAEPRHQPPADAVRARGGQVQRGPHHLRQPAPGGGPGPVQEPPARQGPDRRAPRWPTCTCRSASTATSRSSRRSARCSSSGTRSTTTSSREYTTGFTEYAAHVADLDWDKVEASTGLTREQVTEVARMIAESPATITCWAMGITQHHNAVGTIKEIVNVALLRGDIGKPGAGVCPVRGHSNVQGDRTMGIWERVPDHFLDAIRDEFGFEPPREHGLDTVGSIQALRDGKIRVFMGMGGNFVGAAPDTEATEAAMRNAALTVHVSTKLNRSHVVHGAEALILPVLGRSERDLTGGRVQRVTVEDSMSAVHASHGPLDPPSEHLRSEVDIVCSLALATLGEDSPVPWAAFRDDYTEIRRRIARVVPGCASYDEKVNQPGGFVLPHPPRDNRVFETPSGRAVITSTPLEVLEVPRGRFLLQTMRSHDQFNTTIYGLDDRYRGIKGGRRVVFVNADDLRDLEYAEGDVIDLVSEWHDGVERIARSFRVVTYDQPRGCVAAYYPEANALVPLDSTAEKSNQPVYKSIVVRLDRPGEADQGQGSAHGAPDQGSGSPPRRSAAPPELSGLTAIVGLVLRT